MNDRPRVLVVDDEPQILRALRIILRDAGFDVLQAASVEEALDVGRGRPPAAAIIDLVLPDGDGIDSTRSLRAVVEMPILVLSAVGEEDEKVRALEAGADDYVTKPFGSRELVARLQAALRRVDAGQSEPVLSADGLELDLAARTRPRRRRRGPPDPDRVQAAAHAGPQSRPADDPPRAADRGLGTRVRRRRRGPARARREPAAQDRARRSRRATSGPTLASATASRPSCTPHHLHEICMRVIAVLYAVLHGARSSDRRHGFVAVALALVAFIALYGLIALVDRI